MESREDLRREVVLQNAGLAAEGQVPEGYDSMDDWWETTQRTYAKDLEDPEFAAELAAVLGDGQPRGTGKVRVPRQDRGDRFSSEIPDDEDAPQSKPETEEFGPAFVATVSLVLVVAFLAALVLFGPPAFRLVWSLIVLLSPTGKVVVGMAAFLLLIWALLLGEGHKLKDPKRVRKPYDDFEGDE